MTGQTIAALSDALADLTALARPRVAVLRGAGRWRATATVWRPGVLVASDQALPESAALAAEAGGLTAVLHDGTEARAVLAGRDPGTNVAVLRLPPAPAPAAAPLPPPAETLPRVGGLVVVMAAGPDGQAEPTLCMVQAVGPAWHSMAGGQVDALLRIAGRLTPSQEGGPVVDAAGRLLGMSTIGPRRRTIVIPAATIERAVDPLLERGCIPRGWLGLGLQPVSVPEPMRDAAGREAGLMVISVAGGGPAERAGVLPGDIVLDLDGEAAVHPRAVALRLGPERVGQPCAVRLLRAGAVHTLDATVATRPPA